MADVNNNELCDSNAFHILASQIDIMCHTDVRISQLLNFDHFPSVCAGGRILCGNNDAG